jgi:hypothetical protein
MASGRSLLPFTIRYSLFAIRYSPFAIRRPSPLHQRAIIEPAVEPILIARDILLHRDVDEGLVQRNARNIAEGEPTNPFTSVS